MLGTIEILSTACQALPVKLPMLNNIAGLSKRIVELYTTLDDFANLDEDPATYGASVVSHGGGDHCGHDGRKSLSVGNGDDGGVGSGGDAVVSEPEDTEFRLAVTGLAFSTPDGKRMLAQNLTFIVAEGMGVVIRGPSGCGKSSLVRCIAGLCIVMSEPGCVSAASLSERRSVPWAAAGSPDSGEIRRPHLVGREGIVFMPQRPYMAIGSLRQQVVYPLIESELGKEEDEAITALLVDFGLDDILHSWGLNGWAVWEDILSSGEQQRLQLCAWHRFRTAVP